MNTHSMKDQDSSISNINKVPLLSICIPSFARIDILRNTLNSIYSQIGDVYLEDFEVIVSDNDPSRGSECLIDEFGYPNFKYYSTTVGGFKNSFEALSSGSGELLKLHNNTMLWLSGSLKIMIDFIKHNIEKKPLVFFTNGIMQSNKTSQFATFDQLIYDLSYYSSWSNGFCIWRVDFIKNKNIQLNEYFPQTSLLFAQYYKNLFISSDYPLFKLQTVPNKGGYNLFEVFGEVYLELIETACGNEYITRKTFNKIKRDLLLGFFPLNYFKTVILQVERYDTQGLKKYLKKYYRCYAYYYIVLFGTLFLPYYGIKYCRGQYLSLKNRFSNVYVENLFNPRSR